MADAVASQLVRFLGGEHVKPLPAARRSNTRDLTVLLLNATQSGDQREAKALLDELARRKITDDSDWVYDNFLLFACVAASKRFGLDTPMLGDVCRKRMSVQTGEESAITRTFQSLLDGQNDAPVRYLLLAFEVCGCVARPSDEVLSAAYKQALGVLADEGSTVFRKLVAAVARDRVVALKGLDDPDLRRNQGLFIQTAARRTRIVANVLYWVLLALVSIAWASAVYLYLLGSERSSGLVEKLLSLGFVLAPIGVFRSRNEIAGWIERTLFFALGEAGHGIFIGEPNRRFPEDDRPPRRISTGRGGIGITS